MKNVVAVLILTLAVPCFLMGGCATSPFWNSDFWNNGFWNHDNTDDPTDNDNQNPDDGGGDGGLTIVKTAIPLRFDAGLRCGDDLIAFGTGTNDHTNAGISYVFPSQNPTAGTAVPNNDAYDNQNFTVAGRYIFMAGGNWSTIAYQVSAFNVDTQTLTTFDATDLHLPGLTDDPNGPGYLEASGNYCVVICDPNEVTDGKMIKVIDVSSGTPTTVAFSQNPSASVNLVGQVAVNGTTKKVVVAADDSFWIYDLNNPNTAPQEITTTNGFGQYQMKMYGSYIVATVLDGSGYDTAVLINLDTNTMTALQQAETSCEVAIGGDTFAFFSYHDSDDSIGAHFRTAVGTVSGASFSKPSNDNYIDGSYTGNGTVGYAQTMCIPPSGDYVFIANWYLQYSQGDTSFTVPDDPNGSDTWGCPAWDIDCSENTVGFHSATYTTTREEGVLGYIILE